MAPSAPQIELSTALSQAEPHGTFVRNDVFYLTRAEPELADDTARFVDQVFRPEVFHVGKIPATCTIWAAIKRKNPLCLLNPIFFQVSW